MAVLSFPLGHGKLPEEVLGGDKKACRKIGPCGLGKQALYLGSRFVSRWYYVPWTNVQRVYKRVAMSRGGYTGKGVFGSMAYLVVEYDHGQEKSCYFKFEQEVDLLLSEIEKQHPGLPTHSRAAERRLHEKEREEKRRREAPVSGEAQETLGLLTAAKEYLEKRPELSKELSEAAKMKRVADQLRNSVRIISAAVGILGILLLASGLFLWLSKKDYSMYLLLFGGALFFFVLTSGLFPSKYNSRRYALERWEKAVEENRRYLASWPRSEAFPVRPAYAHPLVLKWMIIMVREGKAKDVRGALSLVMERLRSLNAKVSVSQEEHDDVVEIKPLFLVCDYREDES